VRGLKLGLLPLQHLMLITLLLILSFFDDAFLGEFLGVNEELIDL
jgi:hypothetical protein